MRTVAVVGGHGQIAMKLHPLLSAQGHSVLALARSTNYRAELHEAGAQLRELDIEQATIDDFVKVFEGADVVVFAAGGGPDGNIDRKRSVDLNGSLLAQQAARHVGITRFVQISSMRADDPIPADSPDVWRAYIEAKSQADSALRATDLDWTIIRPGRLVNAPPTGNITLGTRVDVGDVSRADVAAVIAAIIDNDSTIGQQWEFTNGSVPIKQALAEHTRNAKK